MKYIISGSTSRKSLFSTASLGRLTAQSASVSISQPPGDFYLSATHAAVGANIGIYGNGFGSSQGSSTVTFGERPNRKSWASCARTATVVSWSNTYIVCTVPSMSPGKAGAPDTYHPVYLTIGGNLSPSLDFYINPVTTITGQSWVTQQELQSQHNVLYDNCTFYATGGGEPNCAMRLDAGGYNITFHECHFSTSSTASNGVAITENNNSNIRDITFSDCTWGYCERMGFECIARNCTTTQYERIGLIGCTFEPCGSEAISWDGYNAFPSYNLVKDTLVKGAGNGSYPWHFGYEINGGSHITTQNLTIYATHHAQLNLLNGADYLNQACNWVFENCNFDRTVVSPGQVAPSVSSRVMGAWGPMHYSYWYNCIFKVSPETGFNAGQLGEDEPNPKAANYNTFESCSFIGSNASVSQYDGSTGNVGLPT